MSLHVLVGLIAVISGLFGIGGGVLVVPALVLLRYEQRCATGNLLAAIIPTATVGVISYGTIGDLWVPH
ncbi:TSUP family transporter [Protaetiibacter intestinalis]|uniref:TSUP family transporter n=1 Tax=Protaetiibacter intestinalis TaxID=2419774 RepID=UPI001D03C313|nr:TSUP family transporter [Protaetiibacter intestinalis]